VKCAQYQLLFPTLLSLIEKISENKVICHNTFCSGVIQLMLGPFVDDLGLVFKFLQSGEYKPTEDDEIVILTP